MSDNEVGAKVPNHSSVMLPCCNLFSFSALAIYAANGWKTLARVGNVIPGDETIVSIDSTNPTTKPLVVIV